MDRARYRWQGGITGPQRSRHLEKSDAASRTLEVGEVPWDGNSSSRKQAVGGAGATHTAGAPPALDHRLEDGLPSASEVERAFGLHRFREAEAHRLEFARGEVRCVCGCCETWQRWVRGKPLLTSAGGLPVTVHGGGAPLVRYEVITAELVENLASWFAGLAGRRPAPLRVLEVGAGDGRLTLHLRAALRRRGLSSREVQLVATDSGARELAACEPGAVEARDYRSALLEHAPHAVLCSWMPLGEDWTAAFRSSESVETYLLLGEVDDGCCGRPWETWGYDADGTHGSESEGDGESGGESGDESGDAGGGEGEGEGGSVGRKRQCGGLRAARRRSAVDWAQRLPAVDTAGPPGRPEGRPEEDACAWRRVYERRPLRTPFGADGWTRRPLPGVSCQICRTDAPWCNRRHSQAVCFERLPDR